MSIHPTAIISELAIIDDTADIGPYCVIGDNVRISNNVKLHSHICVEGNTTIGENTEIFPFAAIGFKPQDLKYRGEENFIIIGSNNSIREYVTIHPGTSEGGLKTIIGDGNLIMIGAHIAHDCIIGNKNVIGNNSAIAGHVTINDNAILGGMTAYHQFIEIGTGAIVGGGSIVVKNVMPHSTIIGERSHMKGLNNVGLKRRNLSKKVIRELNKLYHDLFSEGSFEDGVNLIEQRLCNAEYDSDAIPFVKDILSFVKKHNNICVPKK